MKPTEEELAMADIGKAETIKGDFNRSHMSLNVLRERGWLIERHPQTGGVSFRNKITRERQSLPFWIVQLLADERAAAMADQKDTERKVRQQMQAAFRHVFGVAGPIPEPVEAEGEHQHAQ